MNIFKKYIQYVVQIFFIFFFIINCSNDLFFSSRNDFIHGRINLIKHDFNKLPTIYLNGEWEFFFNSFIHNDKTSKNHDLLINVPSSWTDYKIENKSLPPLGFASYKLTLLMNPYMKKQLFSLKLNNINTAYRIFWNGKFILENGHIGKNEEDHNPKYDSIIADIQEINDTNELIIEVSNFSHSKAGIISSVEFGTRNEIVRKKELSIMPNFFSVGALFVMSIYHLTLFSIRKKDYAALFFGLFCFTVMFRPLTTEDRLLYRILSNSNWELLNKIEYLSLFISSILFNLFFLVMNRREINKLLILIPTFIISILVFFIIVFKTYLFSRLLSLFEVFLIIQCTYILFVLIKKFFIRGNSKSTALIGLMGFIIFFITILNDIMVSHNYIAIENITHYGLIIFIISQSYLLSVKISKSFSSVEKLSGYLKISNRKLISLKKNLETKVEERTKELKEKSSRIELVGRMTSMIVHDLKNPISSIIGFAELADDSDIGKETRSGYLKTIEIEAYRLSDMSHDILDFVKGEFKIKKEMILIKSFIEEIQKFIYPDIKQFNINLIIDLKYYSIAYLDTDRMRRVILNIFSNSVDALINSGKDSPTFSIKTFEENNFIIMQLSDNGPGISPQIIKSLFQPFATYGKYNGTGLGMAQVKGIIEAHNGTVTFESSDQGTTFFLKIPISREIK